MGGQRTIGVRPWRTGGSPSGSADAVRGDVSDEGELVARLTGRAISAEAFKAKAQRREQIELASAHIAGLLEQQGVPALAATRTAVGLLTSGTVALPQYRRRRILPAVEVGRRTGTAAALVHFVEGEPGRRLVAAVIGARNRCDGTQVRNAIQALGRLVSRLAWASKRFRVDFILRSTEVAIDPDRASDSQYFVHAHVLMIVPDVLFSKDGAYFSDYVIWAKRFLKLKVLDVDVVTEHRAAISYATKPLFLGRSHGKQNLPRTPEEAAALDAALTGLKLLQPLGVFAEFVRQLKSDRVRVEFLDDDDTASTHLVELARRSGAKPRDGGGRGGIARRNRVLRATIPRALISRFREPLLIIANFDPETFERPSRVLGFPTSEVLAIWRRNGAPDPAAALCEAEELLRAPRGAAPPATHTATSDEVLGKHATVRQGSCCRGDRRPLDRIRPPPRAPSEQPTRWEEGLKFSVRPRETCL